MIPEIIKQKIDDLASEFKDQYQANSNTISYYKEGLCDGFSLAESEIKSLNMGIASIANCVEEQKKEIERLKGLIKKIKKEAYYNEGVSWGATHEQTHKHIETSWQQFKQQNNL